MSSNSKSSARANKSRSSGKWYWEVRIDNKQEQVTGIGTSSANLEDYPGDDINGFGYASFGQKCNNGCSGYGASFSAGNIIGIALDLDSGKIWFAKDNVWQASGDPAAGTDEAFSGIAGTFFPMHGLYGISDDATARFNAAEQTYSAPSGFNSIEPALPFFACTTLSAEEYPCYVTLVDPFLATASFSSHPQQETPSVGAFLSTVSGGSTLQVELSCNGSLSSEGVFSCDHCFNYAQISSSAPTPTCKISAVFRYARIDAEAPTPTASFRVGKRIEGKCPTPTFTCIAYSGRNPSIIANAPVPTCSMRVGLSLDAVVPVPTCSMVAITHHLANIFGNVPTPTCTIIASTENIATIYGKVPVPMGNFTTTIGNVASICGRCPVPNCSMRALVGTVVSLYGRVPVPGPLVRFYASPLNVSITLEGDAPVPTMTSSVLCSLPSLVLRHGRGDIR
jgi:hypothetical protein